MLSAGTAAGEGKVMIGRISRPACNREGQEKMKTKDQMQTEEKIPQGVDKVSRYERKIRNEPGEFRMIPKGELNVDHRYQRSKINRRRVMAISRSWDWVACNTLAVSLREDNSWWVIDGQHRKLAADLRPDITTLPCFVFDAEAVKDEALAFLAINMGKVGVAGLDRFRAMLRAGDADAVGLNAVLEATGHKAGASAATKTVCCISTLLKLYRESQERFARLWPLIADMHPSSPVVDAVAKALWVMDKWVGAAAVKRQITDTPYREKCLALGGQNAAALIRQMTVVTGQSNRRVLGAAIAKWLNTQRLPRGFKVAIA